MKKKTTHLHAYSWKTNGGKYFNQVLNVQFWVCFETFFWKIKTKLKIATNWIVQRVIPKCVRPHFVVVAWTSTSIKQVGDKFH